MVVKLKQLKTNNMKSHLITIEMIIEILDKHKKAGHFVSNKTITEDIINLIKNK